MLSKISRLICPRPLRPSRRINQRHRLPARPHRRRPDRPVQVGDTRAVAIERPQGDAEPVLAVVVQHALRDGELGLRADVACVPAKLVPIHKDERPVRGTRRGGRVVGEDEREGHVPLVRGQGQREVGDVVGYPGGRDALVGRGPRGELGE